eukprot:SAG31_NODE_108_length_24741_cov_6.933041_10_plen_481_part_00
MGSFGLRDFEYHEKIGTGAYAKVIRATHKSLPGTGSGAMAPREVAIKVVDKAHVIKHNKVKYVKQERDILQRLVADERGRNHVVSLLATFQTDSELFYVMEARPILMHQSYCSNVNVACSNNGDNGAQLCSGGELLAQLQRRKRPTAAGNIAVGVKMWEAVWWSAALVTALEWLAANGVAHRDLKPENVLLTRDGRVKLCDFGTAKVISPQETAAVMAHAANLLTGAETEHRDPRSARASKSSGKESSSDSEEESDEPAAAEGSHSFVGTAEYVSPEVLSECGATQSSDLWGLGCIVFQMLDPLGNSPFVALDAGNPVAKEYMTMCNVQQHQFQFTDGFPVEARSFVQQLLQRDPWARLGAPRARKPGTADTNWAVAGFADLKAHPFFSSVVDRAEQDSSGTLDNSAPQPAPETDIGHCTGDDSTPGTGDSTEPRSTAGASLNKFAAVLTWAPPDVLPMTLSESMPPEFDMPFDRSNSAC